MKNVLVLTSTFPRWKNDNVSSFVFDLADSLAKKYRTTVLAPHCLNAAKKEYMGRLAVHRFRYFLPEKYQKIAYGAGILTNVKKGTLAKLEIPLFVFSELFNAFKTVNGKKINLLHTHWMIPQGLTGVLIKKVYSIPLIVTIHGSDLFPLKNIFFKKIQKIIIDNADAITINSRAAKNELLSRFPELNNKIKNKLKIIPMGINTRLFKPKNVKVKFKKYKNNSIILFVGRLNEQKGVNYLIRAMQKVISKVKNAKLLIIGDGYYKKILKKIVKELGLENYIEFLGSKGHSEIADYHSLADVFVLPSVTTKIGTESFGLVLVEAMACNTCVIGSSSGGIKNIIRHGKNGLIFKEKSIDDLSYKIIKVLKNRKLREKLANNGYKFATKNFDWGIISKEFSKIYDKLLKGELK